MLPRGPRRASSELSDLRATVLGMEMRWCAECRDDRTFEAPPCQDGHGEDCFDLACVDCGWAIVTGFHEDVVLVETVAA